jgi:hypothetical protein
MTGRHLLEMQMVRWLAQYAANDGAAQQRSGSPYVWMMVLLPTSTCKRHAAAKQEKLLCNVIAAAALEVQW